MRIEHSRIYKSNSKGDKSMADVETHHFWSNKKIPGTFAHGGPGAAGCQPGLAPCLAPDAGGERLYCSIGWYRHRFSWWVEFKKKKRIV